MDHEQKKLVLEAVDKLKEGRADDALLVLERMLYPKFGSWVEAWSNHDTAMQRRGA